MQPKFWNIDFTVKTVSKLGTQTLFNIYTHILNINIFIYYVNIYYIYYFFTIIIIGVFQSYKTT